MQTVPAFWKSTVEDIDEVVGTIQKGRVEVACRTPGGRPVYLIQYGTPNRFDRVANYSSAVGGKSLASYADKTKPDVKPCVFLIAGCHGGEFEGTVALLNLISIFETGRDFQGNENPALADWPKHAHILIIPSLNPDGRARFPYSSVMGMEFETFRTYNQGVWADGTIAEWPEVKRIHPTKGHMKVLGGYFNDDGINIMHDNYFLPMAEETKVLTRTATEYAPDVSIDFHGATANEPHFIPVTLVPTEMLEEMDRFTAQVQEACARENIVFTYHPRESYTPRRQSLYSLGVSTAIHLCCGAYAMTHESKQGVINVGRGLREDGVTHESIYREHMIVLEQTRLFAEEADRKRKAEA